MGILFRKVVGQPDLYAKELSSLLDELRSPFKKGDTVGIKLHWGEKGNRSFLPPVYAREIARWLRKQGAKPFVFDTTALYSGGRRIASDSLKTAEEHGYTNKFLGCPVIIADGPEGRDIIDMPAGFKHFKTVQVASVVEKLNGFVIFSHFKGHMASVFGGAIKNISMGFASRAQKQRMHAEVRPYMNKERCTRCGTCIEICPSGAARLDHEGYPVYDHDTCIGCAQCIAMCGEMALKILWNIEDKIFQEKLIETAAAVWKQIAGRAVVINALINIATECDCLPGEHPMIFHDLGFMGGYHPVELDYESLKLIGTERFEKAHPNIPWQRQFEYARETGFYPHDALRERT
ncbi:MAG TPA: DUF362 domain-containing protein [Syntrophales bacterium]|nr:DUF362 domain-containing protein [Syntrophales bacterium]